MTGVAGPGSVGSGQQGPNDSSSDYNQMVFVIRQIVSRLDTMKLVKVVKVTGGGGAIAAAGTVDVQPLVQQIDGSGNATSLGVVYGLPWWRLQGGVGAVVCDPAVGDLGYVICSDRDTSRVLRTKAQAPPGSLRRYNISDGIYVGGCLNGAPTQYIAFTAAGPVIADAHGHVLRMTSTGFELTGDIAVTGDLRTSGSIFANGQVTALSDTGLFVTLSQHRHIGNNIPPTPGH